MVLSNCCCTRERLVEETKSLTTNDVQCASRSWCSTLGQFLHYPPPEELLKRKPRIQVRKAFSDFIIIIILISGGLVGQRLAETIDLIVVPRMRKRTKLILRARQPRCLPRQPNRSIHELWRLYQHASFLSYGSLTAGCAGKPAFFNSPKSAVPIPISSTKIIFGRCRRA